jgi:hypothetical protein
MREVWLEQTQIFSKVSIYSAAVIVRARKMACRPGNTINCRIQLHC